MDASTEVVAGAGLSYADDEPVLVLTAAAQEELRRFCRARWEGWLAPLGVRGGDRRVVPRPSRLKTRAFPMAFLWQRETSHGTPVTNGAIEIGAVTMAEIRPREDDDNRAWIWGEGYIDLCDPYGRQYARKLEEGMSRWVSIKLDIDPDYEPTPSASDDDAPARVSPAEDAEAWRLMNVTAVAEADFDGATIRLVDDLDDLLDQDAGSDSDTEIESDVDIDDEVADQLLTAAAPSHTTTSVAAIGTEVPAMDTTHLSPSTVAGPQDPPTATPGPASGGSGPVATSGGTVPGDHGRGEMLVAAVTGNTSLPIADRDTEFDEAEARKRVAQWAGGFFKLDAAKMSQAFLFRDSTMSPKIATAYKFPIADVVKGQLKIIPRAVFAAAAALRGARGGTAIPKSDQAGMKNKLNAIYARMRDTWKDPKVRSPFEAPVKADGSPALPAQQVCEMPSWAPRRGRRPRTITASASTWAARVASGVPEEPPAEWFTNPGLPRAVKVRVTDEGRVFGYIAAWDSTHAAFPDLHPPRNRDKSYAKFHRHPVRLADGSSVLTGPLATGGHAESDPGLDMFSVQRHYDDPRYVVADVVAGEDEHGIWVSGALRAGVSPFQVSLADKYSFSGDWRADETGSLELLAACSVSVPGFHLDADDEVHVLTAAAFAAGVSDVPVLAEATPKLINVGEHPTVLIAAGLILEEEEDGVDEVLTAALGEIKNLFSEQLAALRSEFGLANPAAPDTTTVTADATAPASTETADTAAAAPAEPAPVTEGAPAADAATAPATNGEAEGATPAEPADGEPESAVAKELAAFKTLFADLFSTLRADRAALSAAQTPATPAPATDVAVAASAVRAELAAFVHGPAVDERAELAELVHGKAVA